MSKLNNDIIYLIFEKLQDDKKTLLLCLLVNKTWCEMIVPVLWRDPWKYLKNGNEKLLINVIISHLSSQLRNNLSQEIDFLKNSYQKPLFDYISFCRHLKLYEIEKIINIINKKSLIPNIENEIFKLFINEKTKFTHLYIPRQFIRKIHLIPEAEHCFSELQFLSCYSTINDDILPGLTELCKSIKELELFIVEGKYYNYEIIKLIETPKKLFNIRFLTKYHSIIDETFCKILENSLIKHSNNIQYFTIIIQPITNILSSFVNLKRLELDNGFRHMAWNCLENLSLPLLQILKAKGIPIEVLTSLVENTRGHLVEIKIDYISHDVISNKRIIQAIYQNCPNLKYLKLLFRNSNILELEKLLINCQYLSGLYILVNTMFDELNRDGDHMIDWDYLFEILTKSSPNGLFKFKLYFDESPKLESFISFFDNWNGRHPMLLQTIKLDFYEYFDLIEKYKDKGIVKKFDYALHLFEDFEWIQKKI
ncbi:hypothetical protein C1645_881730 [Glomus cerebriforme]|uniref:F-box domain-containing protein n=1 Tax=Glomus cerebriforme TaxID=658196 RepID=A0A397S6T7_9GLOM|nr:hypothetical protein C1645_881730 [Glomus cerebriforme]